MLDLSPICAINIYVIAIQYKQYFTDRTSFLFGVMGIVGEFYFLTVYFVGLKLFPFCSHTKHVLIWFSFTWSRQINSENWLSKVCIFLFAQNQRFFFPIWRKNDFHDQTLISNWAISLKFFSFLYAFLKSFFFGVGLTEATRKHIFLLPASHF